MLSKRQSYLKGAIVLSVGSFISKLLGAIYRIPLISFLGGRGMGIYQMVYPLYCTLLTVSASGIPSGIARLISSGKKGVDERALYLFGAIGLVGSLTMFFLAKTLAIMQGESGIETCAKLLAPSVFFVSILSVIRGYYQGKSNMYPTAITEVIEQLFKVVIGCFLAYICRSNTIKAVQVSIFAVTLSEMIATLYAVWLYLGDKSYKKPLFFVSYTSGKEVLKYTLPITLSAIALPLSQFVESVAVVRLLKGITQDATSIYGVYSGCAVTLVSLPVSLAYGLAVSSIPSIVPLVEKGDMVLARKRVAKSMGLTFLLSLPFAVGLFIFCPITTKILFNGLSISEKTLLINLVRITCVNAVTQSLVQTSSACLTALGKPLVSTRTQWFSCILRVVGSCLLIAFTPLSITGVAISANCSYLVALILNIWYIIRVNKKSKRGVVDNANNLNRPWYLPRRRNPSGRIGA